MNRTNPHRTNLERMANNPETPDIREVYGEYYAMRAFDSASNGQATRSVHRRIEEYRDAAHFAQRALDARLGRLDGILNNTKAEFILRGFRTQ